MGEGEFRTMIDVENIVVTAVKNAVDAEFGPEMTVKVYSYPIAKPESFPCVLVYMFDNYTYRFSQTFGKLRENHTNVTFAVAVYTDNVNTKKTLGKAIFKVVDETLQDLKLTRIMWAPVDNIDRTISRIEARYSGVVGEGITTTIDGEEVTLYPMFRN